MWWVPLVVKTILENRWLVHWSVGSTHMDVALCSEGQDNRAQHCCGLLELIFFKGYLQRSRKGLNPCHLLKFSLLQRLLIRPRNLRVTRSSSLSLIHSNQKAGPMQSSPTTSLESMLYAHPYCYWLSLSQFPISSRLTFSLPTVSSAFLIHLSYCHCGGIMLFLPKILPWLSLLKW